MVGDAAADRRAALRVRVLGGFEVEGVPERALGSRKGRLLAKRLSVAAGRPVPVDELVRTVWPDRVPERAADQLSVLVSRLRAALGRERVRRTDDGYALDLDWLDAIELERRALELEARIAQGQTGPAAAAVQGALALARGPLLPEDDGPWVEQARAASARTLLRIRLAAAEAALGVGDLFGARFAAEQALQEEPYDEAALRLLMRAHVAAGNSAAALGAYARFRTRLAEELGVDPSGETVALHARVLTGDVAREARHATPFVGRHQELRRLDEVLQVAVAGGSGALVVEAPAGGGKSALLTAWCRSPAVSQALCVVGRCDDLAGDLPLQPIIDGLLRHLGDSVDGRTPLLGADRAVLAPVLGLEERGAYTGGGTGVPDVGSRRRTLFRALLDLLRRVAGRRPVVLVVDDLHVAGAGTVEFLSYAARCGQGVAVLAAARPGAAARRLLDAPVLALRPLDIDDAVALVGLERAPRLHARSGGHPLFLTALAAAEDDELPHDVVEVVRERLDALGEAGPTLQVAALLGAVVDVELLVSTTGRRLPDVLDDLDVAVRAQLLEPREMSLVFSHDVVRDVVERTVSPARAAAVHAAAAAILSARPGVTPLAVARHARRSGDPGLASGWLVQAADIAAARQDLQAAGDLLDEAIALVDTAQARLARARVRLASLRFPAALDDALRALHLDGGVAALEVAGWISYYARDYEGARRYADEAVARSAADGVRASCLALAGRVRHTRGELASAEERLVEAVRLAAPDVRGVAQVWHASLLVHRGRVDEAVEVARRGVLEPVRSHPFAGLHGHFTLAHALGAAGRWSEAMDALDALDATAQRLGDAGRRFSPVSDNTRGWLLRAAGALEAAVELHAGVADSLLPAEFLEPHFVSLLDLAEDHLFSGDVPGARSVLDRAAVLETWEGSMAWRQRLRLALVEARLRMESGDHVGAEERADAVYGLAKQLGDARYRTRAAVLRATASASRSTTLRHDVARGAVSALRRLGGPDAWRDLARLAGATGSDPLRFEAQRAAAALVAQFRTRRDVDAEQCSRWIDAQIDVLC